MRVIARISFNNDTGSKFRNVLAKVLEDQGFTNTGTGCWETTDILAPKAFEVMAQVMVLLGNPATVKSLDSGFHLDHVWVYMDQA